MSEVLHLDFDQVAVEIRLSRSVSWRLRVRRGCKPGRISKWLTMTIRRIFTEAFFDGETAHDRGHFLITVENGTIASIERAFGGESHADVTARFVMPGLVDAHVHSFLDGALLDPHQRSAQVDGGPTWMMATARVNLEKCTRAGVTVVRDAGDRFGINHAIRDELRRQTRRLIDFRSAGAGMKRPARYGSLLACDVAGAEDIVTTVAELCCASDDIKIILTGIIDFAAGCVKGPPQFDVDELTSIVSEAHKHGRLTLAHCSGQAGLEVAVAAGVDSIEHGFFMTREVLQAMADKQIAWVPTAAPVYVQWAHPELNGWSPATVANLERILDAHAEYMMLAHRLGVPLVAGSDAGSQGVDHGSGLVDELSHFLRVGLPMEAVLKSATSRPRRLWGMPAATIARGQRADMILLDRSPFTTAEALRTVRDVIKGDTMGDVRRHP